jgi:hypothetical protein
MKKACRTIFKNDEEDEASPHLPPYGKVSHGL